MPRNYWYLFPAKLFHITNFEIQSEISKTKNKILNLSTNLNRSSSTTIFTFVSRLLIYMINIQHKKIQKELVSFLHFFQKSKKKKKTRFPKRKKARGWKIEEGVDRFAVQNPPRDIFIGRIDERSFVPPFEAFDKQRTPFPPLTVFIAPLPPYSRPRECVNFLPRISASNINSSPRPR